MAHGYESSSGHHFFENVAAGLTAVAIAECPDYNPSALGLRWQKICSIFHLVRAPFLPDKSTEGTAAVWLSREQHYHVKSVFQLR
jgi:hypothetical protein